MLAKKLVDSLTSNRGLEFPAWMGEVARGGMAMKHYPTARKALLAQGRPPREIDAMPPLQIILLNLTSQHDQLSDEIVKLLSLPACQALPSLEELANATSTEPRYQESPIIRAMMPAIYRIYIAALRMDRRICSLRGAEALRHHAALHNGQPPARWSDIKAVPLPLDPVTGKGRDDFYQRTGDKGLLLVPSPPGDPLNLIKHFEWSAPGK